TRKIAYHRTLQSISMANHQHDDAEVDRDLLPSDAGSEAHATAETSGNAMVVVIGIDTYRSLPRLHNAVSDALAVQRELVEELGFSSPIEPLLNERATKESITALVADTLRDALHSDDSLILFFAGHGHTRVDRIDRTTTIETGFLVPYEARASH